MTRNSCDADDVAHYLHENPDFFESHVELLASITVPHPHGGRAISLHQRQPEGLRGKLRAPEMKLAGPVRTGPGNDAIAEKLHRWTRQLLLAAEPQRLPEIVVDGLRTIFAVPQVAMRLWGLRDDYLGLEWAQPVAVDAITLANSMKQPFCGPNSDFHAATWLPDGGASTHSIALLPLRKGVDPKAFGLVVLGSSDPERFHSGMGTAFLERIAGTAGAALSRLAE